MNTCCGVTLSQLYNHIICSPCSPWWPFPYLLGVGLVLLLHSFWSRATSWITPTPAMSSFTAADVGCISSLDMSKPTKTAAAHNLVDRCASNLFVSHMISSPHSEDPAKHPHLRGSNLPLDGHLHRPAFAPIRQSRSDYGIVYLRFEPEGNLPVIQNSGQFSPA